MYEIDKIVVATQNPSKKERYWRILSGSVKELVTLSDLVITNKPEETGETAEENAEIKARFYAQKTRLPVFSEDAALYVDFLPLDQQPGVYVRRINGKDEVSDDELLDYWEKKVAQVPQEKRTGKWHTACCLAIPNGNMRIITVDYPLLFFSPSSKIRIPGWPMSSLEGSALIGKPHCEFSKEDQEIVDRKTEELIRENLRELFK